MSQKNEFSHEYKIAYIQAKIGQRVGSQKIFHVVAGSREAALVDFEAQKVEGYEYHILYWES